MTGFAGMEEPLPGDFSRWLKNDGVMFGEQYREAVGKGELKLFGIVPLGNQTSLAGTAKGALDRGLMAW